MSDMKKIMCWILVAASLTFTAAATSATAATRVTAPRKPVASYALGSAKKCKVHYVKKTLTKTEIKKVHGKAAKVKIRYVACVYQAPKKATKTTVTTTTLPPSKTTAPTTTTTAPMPATTTQPPPPTVLGAVDPTFTQSPLDPLAITFQYSASASQVVNGLAQSLSSIPTGVLELFSALSPTAPVGLVCSMNVGGTTTGGNCNVEFQQAGQYQVTTTYLSGTSSATATEPITITPYQTSIEATDDASGSGTTLAPDGSTCIAGPGLGCQLVIASVNGDGDASTPPIGTLTVNVYDNNGNVIATFTPKRAGQTWCLIDWYASVNTNASSPDCTGGGGESGIVFGFQYGVTFAQYGYLTTTTGILHA